MGVIAEAGGSWGTSWDALAREPAAYLGDTLATLLRTVARIGVAALIVAGLALVLHAISRILEQWRALAIRHALGATLRHLTALVCGDLLRLGAIGVGAGLLSALAVIAWLGWSWPVLLARPPFALHVTAAAVLSLGTVCLVLATISVLLLVLLQRGVRLAGELQGVQVTRGGALLFIQSTLATLQLAALFAVANACILIVEDARLAQASAEAAGPGPGSFTTTLPGAFSGTTRPQDRQHAFRGLLATRPDSLLREVALSSPDAWLGMGKEVSVTAFCGDCHIGMFFKPVTGGRARLVAMSPDAIRPMARRTAPGTGLALADSLGARSVAVLSYWAAYDLFPGADPVGKRFRLSASPGTEFTVVGVTGWGAPSVFGNTAREPVVFVSLLQHPPERFEASATTEGARWLTTLKAGQAGDQLKFGQPRTVAERLQEFMGPIGWFAAFFGWLTAATTGIATYSLVAVMSHTVHLREREIAVRLALGAQPHHIERWVTGRTLRITGIGIYLGISGARWVATLLHGPSSGSVDVAWMGAMILAIGFLGLAGSVLPARRAARVMPAAIWAKPTA